MLRGGQATAGREGPPPTVDSHEVPSSHSTPPDRETAEPDAGSPSDRGEVGYQEQQTGVLRSTASSRGVRQRVCGRERM